MPAFLSIEPQDPVSLPIGSNLLHANLDISSIPWRSDVVNGGSLWVTRKNYDF